MESNCKFIFNPEHDLCLAAGDVNFIPPATAVRFAQERAWITGYMPKLQCGGVIVPWGWNAVLKRKLMDEGWPKEDLPSDEQLEFIRENSRREQAQELLAYINNSLYTAEPYSTAYLLPDSYRIVARSMEEIESFLQRHNKIVLKAPLSGSGKGVRFVTGELMETDRGWCHRTLQKQGTVMVEQKMAIQQEFAMLFECLPAVESGQSYVTFRGYSMFYAKNGAYKGNILASNEYMEEILIKYIPYSILHKVQNEVAAWLQRKLQGRYSGFVGVDMFIGEGGMFNPAMEINLRMTMGLIARNIYDSYKEELQLGNGTHCFEPERGINRL